MKQRKNGSEKLELKIENEVLMEDKKKTGDRIQIQENRGI